MHPTLRHQLFFPAIFLSLSKCIFLYNIIIHDIKGQELEIKFYVTVSSCSRVIIYRKKYMDKYNF